MTRRAIQGEGYGKPKVGTSDLPLHRRVQLAVLAHIRHVHTRYDQLLKETEWSKARKAVEKICLDILVKWRGDEETGRDQLDDILREVVVISDESDDSEDSEDDEDGSESSDSDSVVEIIDPDSGRPSPERAMAAVAHKVQKSLTKRQRRLKATANRISKAQRPGAVNSNRQGITKKDKRGFKRYEAVQKRWEEAVNRNRHALNSENTSHVPMARISSHTAQQRPSVEIVSPGPRAEPPRAHPTFSIQQPVYGEGQEDHGYHIRPSGIAPNGSYQVERHTTQIGRPFSAFRPAEGVVVGRRIRRVPAGPPHPSVSEQPPNHGDLKDFLVPSIEPVSPHSRAGPPRTVRSIIREDPLRPEQVPTGTTPAPGQPFVHLDRRPMEADLHPRHVDQGYRSAAVTGGMVRPSPRHEYIYDSDSRSHSTSGFLDEANRTYIVRQPCGYPQGTPVATSTRMIRVQREARPAEVWGPEPARMRQDSPHVVGRYGRASPSMAYELPEHQRIIYREAQASRLEPQYQGSAPESGRPLYYEVPSPAPSQPQAAGSWQGSTYVRAEPMVSRTHAPVGPRDGQIRFDEQESSPFHRAPAANPQSWRVKT